MSEGISPKLNSQRVETVFGYSVDLPDINADYNNKPDTLAYLRRFGLIVPAEHGVVTHDLWKMVMENKQKGIGFLSSAFHCDLNRIQPTDEYAEEYSNPHPEILAAVKNVMYGQPQYLIFGCSLEPFMRNQKANKAFQDRIEKMTGLQVSTSTEAFPHALRLFGAKRIAILTPYQEAGDSNTKAYFQECGFEVVAIKGLRISNPQAMPHIQPEEIREAILNHLNRDDVDAIIQSGTAISCVEVADNLEKEIGKPIIPINVVLLWFALRESGINLKLGNSTRLLREF